MLEGLRVSPEERTDDIELWLSNLGPEFAESEACETSHHIAKIRLLNSKNLRLRTQK